MVVLNEIGIVVGDDYDGAAGGAGLGEEARSGGVAPGSGGVAGGWVRVHF